MDSSTPEELFTQVTDIRTQSSGNSGVEIFISIGGWSLSDNGTTTQDVYGSIAADAGKRQQFADNLVSFMKEFGFDGVGTTIWFQRLVANPKRSTLIGNTLVPPIGEAKSQIPKVTFCLSKR